MNNQKYYIGHGQYGDTVSGFLHKYFEKEFENNKLLQGEPKDESTIYNNLKNSNYSFIQHVFENAEKELKKAGIDANFSGSTCVMLFQVKDKLICANVGDSRCIMCTKSKSTALSIDQKPNDPKEMERIQRRGGEVSQFVEDGQASGPFRVWMKGYFNNNKYFIIFSIL